MDILRDICLLPVVKHEVSSQDVAPAIYRSILKLHHLSVKHRVLRGFVCLTLRVKTYVSVLTFFRLKELAVNRNKLKVQHLNHILIISKLGALVHSVVRRLVKLTYIVSTFLLCFLSNLFVLLFRKLITCNPLKFLYWYLPYVSSIDEIAKVWIFCKAVNEAGGINIARLQSLLGIVVSLDYRHA